MRKSTVQGRAQLSVKEWPQCEIVDISFSKMRYFTTTTRNFTVADVSADIKLCLLCKNKVEGEVHFLFDHANYIELKNNVINTTFTNQ